MTLPCTCTALQCIDCRSQSAREQPLGGALSFLSERAKYRSCPLSSCASPHEILALLSLDNESATMTRGGALTISVCVNGTRSLSATRFSKIRSACSHRPSPSSSVQRSSSKTSNCSSDAPMTYRQRTAHASKGMQATLAKGDCTCTALAR
jgi:hypothetical protein